ncbi:MAG: hypothetical protein P8P88_03480 [Polaribacter sp.]|nr:hypothetical protein [Polaribacter sp.]
MNLDNLSKYFYLFLLLFILNSCKKTDWKEKYKEEEKSPFGAYIVYNEAKNLFENEKVVLLKDNFYDYLIKNYSDSLSDFGNYICIKNDASKLPKEGVNDLLSFVYDGNSAFLALNYFNDNLKEKLEITTNNLSKDIRSLKGLKSLKGELYLENESHKNQTFTFDRNIRKHYFVTYNENKTVVLGSSKIDGEKVPNFLKIYHGKGTIYVHSNPIVFTNYYLLKDKETYAENVLSYLPSSTLFWDPQIKFSQYANKDNNNQSVFNFFLKHKSLTWFLAVILFGVLLFMIFNARRKQRVIPIIHPLKNNTIAFTQTISSLYLKEQNHKNLVDKKIKYFLEKVRTKYFLDTNNLNKEFIQKLASKSGNKLQNTRYLVNTIITLDKKLECTQEELLTLHKMISIYFKK